MTSRRVLQQLADAHRAYATANPNLYDKHYHIGMAHAYESLIDQPLRLRMKLLAKATPKPARVAARSH